MEKDRGNDGMPKREVKDSARIRFNDTEDFVDYKITLFNKESGQELEKAFCDFCSTIGKILEKDRIIVGKNVFVEDYEYVSPSERPEGTSGTQQSSESSYSMFHDNEAEEKLDWLKSIGAAAFQEPIKYIYTFPDYNGAFNLSERYIAEKTLVELKAQYEKNKVYVQEILRSKKSRDDFLRGAEPL